ncbi:MAG: glycosyltransferase [Candidatus Saccharimonas sp.]|nr:glycosyltransferase [Candidatus Saccharimonas sp.]
MTKKRLIIDGQIFQTDARDRGMGRYSSRLISAIIDQKRYLHIEIILTKNRHANPLTKEFAANMLAGASLVYLDLVDTSRTKIENAEEHNKKEIERHIEHSRYEKSKIDFLIPSPFQEPVASVYPDGVKKIVVFYDLIPYLYHFRYELVMQFVSYLKRFHLLFDADVILAISQSVKDDLMVYLGLPESRIVTIDGAPIKSQADPEKPAGIDVPTRYVLMPTSDDPRKNNLRAVLGFEEFRAARELDYKLVITSKIHHTEQDRLRIFSKNLVFTGNVSEHELDWLYGNCDAVLFVPESEGLGLPILEGVLANKRIVCSTLNVFKEISADGFYFCDHEDQHSIALALTRALSSGATSISKKAYEDILKHYSWEATGLRTVEGIENIVHREASREKPRLAVITPTPSGLSAVGKVVAENHASLSEIYDVDYYAEDGQHGHATRPNFLPYVAKNYFPAAMFSVEMYNNYDAVVYHIGNSDYHLESITTSLYLPGYVILHDTNIGEAYRILCEQDTISTERFELEKAIDTKRKIVRSSFISSVCSRQLGVITHSRYAAGAVEEANGGSGLPVTIAQLPTNTPTTMLERNYSSPVVGLAGIIADIKGIGVIESIAENPKFDNVKIKLFGYNFASEDTIQRLREYHNVTVSTNLTDFDFTNSISKLDVFMNYRMEYQGETSLSTLEAMRQGVVVIVRDIGWYAELPDDVVVKVSSPENAIEKLSWLLNHPEEMKRYSNNAREYTKTQHASSSYAYSIRQSIANSKKNNTQVQFEQEIKSSKIMTKSDAIKWLKGRVDT